MKCPKCGSKKTQVIRTIKKSNFNVRYKKCLKCTWKFKTIETLSDGWDYKKIVQNIKKMLKDVE